MADAKGDRPADWAGGCGVSLGGLADMQRVGRQAVQRVGSSDLAGGKNNEWARAGLESGSADCERPGPVNGFWRAADWLGCRDDKWRAVEPGTFPLAYGVAGRVGRLRAYGNAINAQAAQAFIEAVMESV